MPELRQQEELQSPALDREGASVGEPAVNLLAERSTGMSVAILAFLKQLQR